MADVTYDAIQHVGIDDSVFNIKKASEQFSVMADKSNTAMDEAMKALNEDPNNPALLANFQSAINEFSVVMNLVATIQKAIKDSMSSIVQKM